MARMRIELLIGLVAALLFMPFLGAVHLFDWDEINFAECAREMVASGNYGQVQMNFLPFWEKPPLFFWMQAASMHIFGVGDFAARFPNAICGMATLVYLYYIGARLHGPNFGLLWVLMYAGSLLPHFYFHSGLIDPWFNLFIFAALHNFVLYAWAKRITWQSPADGKRWQYLAKCGLLLGLAIITKGPVALLIVGLVGFAYWVVVRFRLYFSFGALLSVLLWCAGVLGLWLGYELVVHGPYVVQEFLIYNVRLFSTPDAGHGGFPGYHVVVLLVGCFPASLFFIRSFWPIDDERSYLTDYTLWLRILFFVVLVLFSIVQSKIVHYSSLCYFPLTYLAALAATQMMSKKTEVPWYVHFGIYFFSIVIGLATLAFPWLAAHPEVLKPLLAKDPFAMANLDATADMHWLGIEWLVGLWVLGLAIYSTYLLRNKRVEHGVLTLLAGTALSVVFILWAYIGRIERFSQGAAIDFLESKAAEDCIIIPIGYRTYTHFYYGRLRPANAPPYSAIEAKQLVPTAWRDSVLNARLTKPVYVISKINKTAEVAAYEGLEETGRKNGFVFYKKVR